MHLIITESNCSLWYMCIYTYRHTYTHIYEPHNTSSQIQSKSRKMNPENQVAALMNCLAIQSINILYYMAIYLCTKHFDIQCNDAK